MVGFVVGEVGLEQMESLVDGRIEADPLRTRSMAPMPPAESPWTRSASS